MTKRKAPPSGANETLLPAHPIEESAASQAARIVEYLQAQGTLTTLEARQRLGVMNPAQRISELRNRLGLPIETGRTYQADETGAIHLVACYIWRGGQAKQMDLWGK